MKRTTKIAVTILTISAVAAGTTAIARGGHGNVGDRIVHRVSERLDLNEQQAANLKNLQSEIMETRGLMLGNADADRQTLADLVGAESFDQGAALEMITARTTAMQTQAPELVAAAASFLDALDTEQKEEVATMMQRIGKHGKGRKGNRVQ